MRDKIRAALFREIGNATSAAAEAMLEEGRPESVGPFDNATTEWLSEMFSTTNATMWMTGFQIGCLLGIRHPDAAVKYQTLFVVEAFEDDAAEVAIGDDEIIARLVKGAEGE